MTAISLDHTHVLGSTIAQIAREKAGIFKPHTQVVSVAQVEECDTVYRRIAQETPAPIAFLEKEIEFTARFESTGNGQLARICVETGQSVFEHVPVPLIGFHQPYNCGLALAVVDRLRRRHWDLPDAGVVNGLASTILPGRMETVCDDPRIIIDGAHNPESVVSLMRTLCANEKYDSLFVIFGCASDKDADGMLKAISGAADKVVFTRSSVNPRAADPEMLLERFTKITGRSAMVCDNLESALDTARSAVQRRDLVVITGSFYLVGQARRLLLPDGENPRLIRTRPTPEHTEPPIPRIPRRDRSHKDIDRSP
jgi:dihydrofolate synthase/folylpolyglutamate synthase